MIDPELVNRKLSLILEDIETLRDFETLPQESYLQDLQTRLIIERLLERIINRLIDLNFHVLSEKGHSPPKDYYESFYKLHELDFYSVQEAERWANLAGLRNRLAHEYNELDHKLVYQAFVRLLDQLPELLQTYQDRFGSSPS